MKFFMLVLLFSAACAQDFAVKDGNKTCARLRLKGSLGLTAMNKTEPEGQLTLMFDSAVLDENNSNCTRITLKMGEVMTWFEFTTQSGEWLVTTSVTFNPSVVFNETAPDNATLTFTGTPLDTFSKNGSYLCNAESKEELTGPNGTVFTYKVEGDVSGFQIQSTDSENFAPADEECSADNTTTTSTPTTPTTSTASPTTTSSMTTVKPLTPEYTCGDGKTASIRMTGDFALAIQYNMTTGSGKQEPATAYINLPQGTVNTQNSSCDANLTTELLALDFYQGWRIAFRFGKGSSSDLAASDDVDFSVNNITVTYVYDEHFVNATEKGKTATVVFSEKGKNYLKATTKGYYTCKSNTSITADNVEMSTKNFRYTAFSTNNATFKGDVAECSADEDSSSVVPIAVGAALAGLVVIVLIAYLIGRRRARKSGYESV